MRIETADLTERVRVNQEKLIANLKPHYDFIVCGSGSSGSVVARRLAENPDVSVLLVEAGGTDDVPNVIEAIQWPLNRASERNWGFQGQSSPFLNGRSMPLYMGKVLGGGASINAMAWARGRITLRPEQSLHDGQVVVVARCSRRDATNTRCNRTGVSSARPILAVRSALTTFAISESLYCLFLPKLSSAARSRSCRAVC